MILSNGPKGCNCCSFVRVNFGLRVFFTNSDLQYLYTIFRKIVKQQMPR